MTLLHLKPGEKGQTRSRSRESGKAFEHHFVQRGGMVLLAGLCSNSQCPDRAAVAQVHIPAFIAEKDGLSGSTDLLITGYNLVQC